MVVKQSQEPVGMFEQQDCLTFTRSIFPLNSKVTVKESSRLLHSNVTINQRKMVPLTRALVVAQELPRCACGSFHER